MKGRPDEFDFNLIRYRSVVKEHKADKQRSFKPNSYVCYVSVKERTEWGSKLVQNDPKMITNTDKFLNLIEKR